MYWTPFMAFIEPTTLVKIINDYIESNGDIRLRDMTEEEIVDEQQVENPYLHGPLKVLQVELAFGMMGAQEWLCLQCELSGQRYRDIFFNTHNILWVVEQVPLIKKFNMFNKEVVEMQRTAPTPKQLALMFDMFKEIAPRYELRTVYRKRPPGFAFFLGGHNDER